MSVITAEKTGRPYKPNNTEPLCQSCSCDEDWKVKSADFQPFDGFSRVTSAVNKHQEDSVGPPSSSSSSQIDFKSVTRGLTVCVRTAKVQTHSVSAARTFKHFTLHLRSWPLVNMQGMTVSRKMLEAFCRAVKLQTSSHQFICFSIFSEFNCCYNIRQSC